MSVHVPLGENRMKTMIKWVLGCRRGRDLHLVQIIVKMAIRQLNNAGNHIYDMSRVERVRTWLRENCLYLSPTRTTTVIT